MKEYSSTEARKKFASLLNVAKEEGAVCIKKRNGEIFYLTPEKRKSSPLDVEGVNLHMTKAGIVEAIRTSRERSHLLLNQ